MNPVEKAFGIVPIALPTPFPVGPVNVYLIKDDPPLLVDTGIKNDESYALLSAELKQHGYALTDLGAIIVTHGHRDHVGLLGRLAEESGAKTYGHPIVAKQGTADTVDAVPRKQFYIDILREFGVPEEITGQANSLYDRFRALSEPFRIDHIVEDGGEVLGYETHFVPGHSASCTLFVNRAKGFTLAGDHLLVKTNPNPLLRRPERGEERPKALLEYRASLGKARDLGLGTCLPGHGDPFDNPVEVIDRILERQDRRTERVLALLNEAEGTPYAISKRLFPELPLPNLHLGLSIAVGHLEVLEAEGLVKRAPENGVLRFMPS